MPKNLNDFTPASGRMRKEDGTVINIADLLEQISTGSLEGDALLDAVEDITLALGFTTAAAVQTTDAVDDFKDVSLGQDGGKSITGTNAVTPATGNYYFAIQIIADTVVAAQGNVAGAVNPDLTDFTVLSAGTIIYGKWNSITLTSGEAIGYYRET